jgi:hypothetical protein
VPTVPEVGDKPVIVGFTVKLIALLRCPKPNESRISTMTGPEAAHAGTVVMIVVLVVLDKFAGHEEPRASLKTTPEEVKLMPVSVSELLRDPEVADRLVRTGGAI